MAVSHVFSNDVPDFTGTITGFNSQGSTVTVEASVLVRPSDWNSAHNQFFTLSGNTTGNTTVSGTNVVFHGSGGVSVGGSNATELIISGPLNSGFHPYEQAVNVVAAAGNASLWFYPVAVPTPFQHDRACLPFHYSQATNSTLTVSCSVWFGFYVRSVASLLLLQSGSGSFTINGSGTASSGENSGIRLATFGNTNTVIAGNYHLGVVSRTSTAGANASLSNLVRSQLNSSYSGLIGVATNASNQSVMGLGVWSATTAGLPFAVSLSDVRGNSSAFQRPPIIYFTSGGFPS